MKSTARHISVAVACAAALAGCSNAGSDQSSGADPSTAGPSASTSTSASASPSASSSASASGAAKPSKSGKPASSSASPDEPTAPATSPAPTGSSSGPLEVLPPSPSQSGLPGISPAPKPDEPLISRPLPAKGTARGGLVRGYPSGVLPPAPDSTIEDSSVSPGGGRLQVALTAGTGRGSGAVLLFYRQQLTALGFTEDDVSAATGSQAAGFRRGQSSVTVTVSSKGDVSSYTLFSTLYAG